MPRKHAGVSAEAKKLINKIYKLKARAMKIVGQSEKLAKDAAGNKALATRANKILIEARAMADEARPAKKIDS